MVTPEIPAETDALYSVIFRAQEKAVLSGFSCFNPSRLAQSADGWVRLL